MVQTKLLGKSGCPLLKRKKINYEEPNQKFTTKPADLNFNKHYNCYIY